MIEKVVCPVAYIGNQYFGPKLREAFLLLTDECFFLIRRYLFFASVSFELSDIDLPIFIEGHF
ncbi:MAG: hypothetical protein ACK5VH_03175, partial [bacterium]